MRRACVGFHNGAWRSRENMHVGDFRRERLVIAPARELGGCLAGTLGDGPCRRVDRYTIHPIAIGQACSLLDTSGSQ